MKLEEGGIYYHPEYGKVVFLRYGPMDAGLATVVVSTGEGSQFVLERELRALNALLRG